MHRKTVNMQLKRMSKVPRPLGWLTQPFIESGDVVLLSAAANLRSTITKMALICGMIEAAKNFPSEKPSTLKKLNDFSQYIFVQAYFSLPIATLVKCIIQWLRKSIPRL